MIILLLHCLQDTKTALYWSAEKNNADIARVLVDYNPDTEVSTTVSHTHRGFQSGAWADTRFLYMGFVM